MSTNLDDPGIPEFECDECGEKTQDYNYMYYVEKYQSETRADQTLCPECWEGFVKDGTIVLTADCPCTGCNEEEKS